MPKEELKAITIGRYICNEITGNLQPEEQEKLRAWLDEAIANQKLYERIRSTSEQHTVYQELEAHFDADKALKEVLPLLKTNENHRIRIYRKLKRYPIYAAAVLLLITLCWWLFFIPTNQPQNTNAGLDQIKPAGKKAYIELSNGQRLSLDSTQQEVEISNGILQYANGKGKQQLHVAQAKIVTPRGGTYTIVLSDGSRVSLNAGSTLEYPTKFTGANRVVSLTGEAYFEVTKNAERPFIVQSSNQRIQVLGTKFNVNTFDKHQGTKTTLTEGTVRVDHTKDKKTINLMPGQQSILNERDIIVKNIDVQTEIAWRNKKFNFEGKLLKEILPELSRWYDVDIIYDKIPDIEFYGGAYRTDNIKTVLNILEVNGITYTYNQENRTINLNTTRQ